MVGVLRMEKFSENDLFLETIAGEIIAEADRGTENEFMIEEIEVRHSFLLGVD